MAETMLENIVRVRMPWPVPVTCANCLDVPPDEVGVAISIRWQGTREVGVRNKQMRLGHYRWAPSLPIVS